MNTDFKGYLCGALSGVCTIMAVQPLFTLSNLKMTNHPIPPFSNHPLFYWTGLAPNLVAEVASQAISYGSYHLIKGRLDNDHAAIIAGVCNAFVLAPLERIMVQQQVFKGSSADVVKRICQMEGVRFLFKGVTPTIAREAIFTHTAYHSSDRIGSLLHKYIPHQQAADMAAQLGLGVLCGATTTPVARVAAMMRSDLTKMEMRGVMTKIMKEEGITGFFKGYKERALQIGVIMVVMKQSQSLVSQFFEKL